MFPGCCSGQYLRVAPSDYALGSASGRLTGRAFLPSTLRPACCLPRSGLDAKIRFFRIASFFLPGKRGLRIHSDYHAVPMRQLLPALPVVQRPCGSPARLRLSSRAHALALAGSVHCAAPVQQFRSVLPVLPRPCASLARSCPVHATVLFRPDHPVVNPCQPLHCRGVCGAAPLCRASSATEFCPATAVERKKVAKKFAVFKNGCIFALAIPKRGALVQLVRIRACHARGQGFESPTHRQKPTKSQAK